MLLNAFRTGELSLDTIDEEVEIVRQQIYDNKRKEITYDSILRI